MSWPAESGGTLAFADAGPGNVISFVCIESSEFPGGEAGPFTANGVVADGCFIIDGIGTDVVAVFRELPDVRPGCDTIISISAGLQGDPEPTATPTMQTPTTVPATATAVPPTATAPVSTATSVPSATATMPSATATRTATTPPMATSTMPPSSTPTMVSPTAVGTSPTGPTSTPVRPTILPPNTGGGTSGGSGGSAMLFAGFAILMVAAGAGALVVNRQTQRNRS